MTFENGSRIGDYEIVAPLGAGGMGQVYKVRNLITDRVEAMKVLLPNLASEPSLADRFLREIKVQANLDHPNIAKLYSAQHIGDQLLMLMEFVEGVSLDRRIREGPVPVADAVEHVVQVLAALDYAHQHGVIHRDIKPANMMLTPAGRIKLMDFGIAKATAEPGLTGTGMTVGSLYYMSPEQIQGGAVDNRSDLYSVGISLYEMVTGRKPFDGTTQFSIMNAHLEKTPVPPIELDARIPPALNELIVLSLNRDPARRFQSAAAFRNALSSLQPESIRPVQAPSATVAHARSRRALWVAAGGLCTVLAIIAVIQFGPRTRTQAGAPQPAPSQPTVSPQQVPSQPAAPAPAPSSSAPPSTAPPAAETMPTAIPPAATALPARRAAHPAAQTQVHQEPGAPPADSPSTSTAPPPPNPATSAPVPNKPDMEPLREQFTQLDGRAESIHGTLDNLQRSQAAQGLSLRGDWTTARRLMDSYLGQANAALAGDDAASAKAYLEKAERQIAFLEKALNK